MKRAYLKRGTSQLARSGFKRKTYAQVKEATIAKQKSLKVAKRASKTKSKGYQPPKWFTSIKLGSHGSTPAQKKYWKITSDKYRKEDFERYKGKCVSCPTRLKRWQDGQLAHYKAWSICNSWFKYERMNLALSCANCNRLSDGVTGMAFGKELQRRHGATVLAWIEEKNKEYRGQKMEVWEIVEKTQALLEST